MNAIEWTRKAAKQLRRLDRPQQVQIRDAVNALMEFPHCSNVKSLTNHKYSYRLRVGRYRVFFEYQGPIKIVLIEEVVKRDERTY